MKIDKKPMHYKLAEWFHKQPREVINKREHVAQAIRHIKRNHGVDRPVTLDELHQWISHVRTRLELTKGVTIVCIPKQGFKVANDQEYADFTLTWSKRTLMCMDRTKRLIPYLNERCIKESIRKEFARLGDRIKTMPEEHRGFILALIKERKEVKENERKAIKDKRNGEK